MKNRLSRDLLDAYVGPHASEQILTRAVHRGDGFTIEAVIKVIDLRNFMSLSELWPRDDVVTSSVTISTPSPIPSRCMGARFPSSWATAC